MIEHNAVIDVMHHERNGETGLVHILRVTCRAKVMELELSPELWQKLGENAKWFEKRTEESK